MQKGLDLALAAGPVKACVTAPLTTLARSLQTTAINQGPVDLDYAPVHLLTIGTCWVAVPKTGSADADA